MCLDFGMPKNNHFPFGANGKFVILGVLIFKHVTVLTASVRQI